MAATQLPEPFGPFAGSFAKLAERNRAMFERTLCAVQEESLRAIQRHLERNARAIEDLGHADGIGRLMTVEQNWLFGAMQDSLEDTQRMATFWFRVAGNGSDAVADTARETVRQGEDLMQKADGERARKSAHAVK